MKKDEKMILQKQTIDKQQHSVHVRTYNQTEQIVNNVSQAFNRFT